MGCWEIPLPEEAESLLCEATESVIHGEMIVTL